MRIDLIEHRDLVRGASEVEDTAEGVRCRRMTPEAMALYADTERFYRRTCFSAGIRIALATDSSFISMRLKQGVEETGAAGKVDVLVNRSECHTYSPDEDLDEFCFTVELPQDDQEDHEVEILLPIDGEVLIQDLELADGSLFRPLYCSDERMIMLGDSITMGRAATSPLRSYASLLAATLGTDYVNWGVGGVQLDARLGELALALEWQTALVAYGINDYHNNRSARECAAELTALLEKLTDRPGVTVYVVTPLVWPEREKVPNARGDRPEDFRRELAAAAKAFEEAAVIEGATLLKAKDKYFDPDHLHPADAGMALIAENLCAAILKCRDHGKK
jgi:lysophospholipase L1-like esterase